MTDADRFIPFARRYARWRRRFLFRLERIRLGLAYAIGRLSVDDAQQILVDCHYPAGWHPLMTLCVEDTLDEARELFEDHPDLPRLVNDACARVAYKWENYCDELYEARRWALDLVRCYAQTDGVALVARDQQDNALIQ